MKQLPVSDSTIYETITFAIELAALCSRNNNSKNRNIISKNSNIKNKTSNISDKAF